MQNEITLTIALPSKTYLSKKVASVILPAVRADVDILPNRAPSVFMLDYGLLQILDRFGSVTESYFLKLGVADIAQNNCHVMTQYVIPYEKINPSEAKKKAEAATDEDDKLFFQMILDYQRGIRRRYLRTLNVFGDKSEMVKSHEENIQEVKDELEMLRKRFSK